MEAPLRAPSFPGAIWPVRTQNNHSTHSARHNYLAVPQHQTRSDEFEVPETRPEAPIANGDAFMQESRATKPVNQYRMWNPFWLHRGVLLAFCVSFFLMITAVAALYIVSQKHQGLSTQTPQYRYLWTYGPTAILTIVASLWFQVDYWCRLLTPWRNLSNGPSPAGRTVLLDYVLASSPSALYAALRAKEWAVVISGIGMISMKVAIIFSTGLIVLKPRIVSYFGQELILTGQFDATGFHPSLVNGSSFTTFYGIATEGLPYPVGTSEDLVVPYFNVQGDAATNQSWQATVSGLSTDLHCETIHSINITKPQPILWRSVLAEWYLADVRTPSCNISQVIVAKGLDNNPTSIPVLKQYQGWWGNYTCNDGIPADTYYGYRPVKAGPHEHVLLLTTSLMRWNQSQNYRRQEWVDETTMVMCRPSYQVKKYEVSFASEPDPKQLLSARAAPGPVQTLAGLQPVDLISAAKFAASNANLGLNSQDNYDLQPLDELFHLMSIAKGQPKSSTNLSVFMDGDVLASYGKRAVIGVITQAIHDAIIRPVNETLAGTIQRYENRLQVEKVSMALIIATLGLMCIFTVCEIFTSPQNVVPRDPRTWPRPLPSSIPVKGCLLGSGPVCLIRVLRELYSPAWYPRRDMASRASLVLRVLSMTRARITKTMSTIMSDGGNRPLSVFGTLYSLLACL